jgi:hypothetical protein
MMWLIRHAMVSFGSLNGIALVDSCIAWLCPLYVAQWR